MGTTSAYIGDTKIETGEELIEQYSGWYAKHEIMAIGGSADLSGWLIHVPGEGRAQSTALIDSCEGLIILGDWTPSNNNTALNARFKRLRWFLGDRMSPDYLAEKFLESKWCPLRAAHSMIDTIKQLRDEESGRTPLVGDLQGVLDNEGFTPFESSESYRESFEHFFAAHYDFEFWWPSWRPTFKETAHLAAFQRRFRELFLTKHDFDAHGNVILRTR